MSRSSNGEGNGLLSHPCGFDSCTRHFCFARSTEEDSSLLSRKCGFKSRAKHYGYVAKRLCSGLLTRQTQVRPLSCPLRSGDVTAAYRSSKPGVRVQSPFRLLISRKVGYYGFIAQLVERPAVNRMVAGSSPAVPSLWSFVQWQGTCLIRSLRGFESRSSDHASLA